MQLKSYVQGRWHAGERDAQQLRDATTGRSIAEASSSGVDFARVLQHARSKGGPALRQLTFPRACGAAQAAREAADGRRRTSSTRCLMRPARPRQIPGSTSTAASARCSRTHAAARASCRTAACTWMARSKRLSKTGTFIGQHICVPLEGAAIHINAFNFPVWGMLEKLAPTLLAGMPAIVKPATTTAYLTELVVRRIVESGILPEGALQLVCGSLGDALRASHLPGRRFVHRLGEHRAEAAHASGDRRELRAVHQRDRFHQLLRARARRRAGPAGVRRVRARSRARDDGEGGPEVHRDPQGHRSGGARRSCRAGDQGRRSPRSSSAIRGWSRCAWARSPRSRQRREVLGRIAELQARSRIAHRRSRDAGAGGRGSREGRVRGAGAAVLSRAREGESRAHGRSIRAGVHSRARMRL